MTLSNGFASKWSRLFIAVMLLVGICFGSSPTIVSAGTGTVAKWDWGWTASGVPYNNGSAPLSTNASGGTLGAFYTSTGAPPGYSTVYSSDGWANGANSKYWKAAFKTTGMHSLTVSSQQMSYSQAGFTGYDGPRDFKLQYSLDNATWTDVPGGTLTLSSTWSAGGRLTNLALPAAMENRSTNVYLRWIMTSNAAVADQGFTNAAQSMIGGIVITGSETAQAPSDITLSNNTLSSADPVGTTVGTLTAVDSNYFETISFSLVSGEGSTNNGSFTLVGGTLKTNSTLTGGTYSVRVNANDGTYDFAKAFSITVTQQTSYPDITGGDTTWLTGDYTTNVTFAGINKNSGNDDGYADYTAEVGTVSPGASQLLSVSIHLSDPTYPAAIVAWFDWNRDFDFNDDGEKYVVATNVGQGGSEGIYTHSTTIAVPAVAPGSTRLRVASTADTGTKEPPNAGSDIFYGEAEDYTINLVKPEPTNYPSAFTATASGATQITTSWTDATTGTAPDGYVLLCNKTGAFTSPVDGTAQADDSNCADGSGVKNVAQGTGTYAWTALTNYTTYYFKIFPYTNSGSSINYKTDGTPSNTASATLVDPPAIAKAFGAATIPLNGVTTLTFTLTNPNPGLTLNNLAFSDSLLGGLKVADTAIAGSCTGSFSPALAVDATSLSYSLASLAADSSCTVVVNIKGTQAGSVNNATSTITSSNGGTGSASAAVSIAVLAPPTISKAFGASSIPLHGTTSLTFTVTNPNASGTLTGVSFDDNLPAGVTLSSATVTAANCGTPSYSGNTIGSTTFSVSGASVTSGTPCTIGVTVQGTQAGSRSNTASAITSAQGGTGTTSNTALLAVIAPPVIAMTFADPVLTANSFTTLTITVTNPTTNTVALTGVGFTDNLASASLQVANPANSSNSCGGAFAPNPGDTSLSLSGGTVPASSACAVAVRVTGATPGVHTNTTSAVTSTNGSTGNAASANITVGGPPEISKTFAAATKAVNEPTALTFTITNTNSGMALTGIGFSDYLPSGLQVASTPNPSNSCGGTFTTLAGSSAVTLTNGNRAAGQSCSLSVDVVGATVGTKNNMTGNVTSSEGGNGNAATASVTIAKGASTISLAKAPAAPTTYGDTVYLTATVASALAGPAAPSGGAVEFFDGSTALGPAVALSGGQASLSANLLSVGTHGSITAVYTGDTNFDASPSSSPVSQQVNQATPNFSNLSSPTISYGTASTTISGTLKYGALIPTGNVTVTLNGVQQAAAINVTTGNFSSDFATASLPVSGSPYAIAMNYPGDTNFAARSDSSQTVTITKDNTSVAGSSSADPSTYGDLVTISATVTSSGPSVAVPTGTVTFTLGSSLTLTGTVNGSGVASFSRNDLAAGAHSIQITYSGDGNFNGSTQTFVQDVNRATPAFSSLSAPTMVYGTTPTAISGNLKLGSFVPTGSVTITLNGVQQSAAVNATTGNFGSGFATSGLVVSGSPYAIGFSYPGDSNFASASGSSTLTVVPAATAVTITGHTPTSSILNQSVTFTASVTSTQGNPTGTVSFNDGASALGSSTLDAGIATLTVSDLAVGTHTITATYPANGNYAASTSPSVTHVVDLAPTTATITGHTPSPSIYNQTVTFTATVTSTQGAPSGTVTLQEGATILGTTTLSADKAVFSISSLPVGSHTITVTYQTDGSYRSSTSPSITHAVDKASTATTIASSVPTTVFGQSVTFSATVSSSQGVPTGTVTFLDNGGSLGDVNLDASGSATLTTSALSVTGSPHTITARYNGDANFADGTSAGLAQHVNPASTTTTLAASTTKSTYGQSVYFTATLYVVTPASGTPTGSVTFYDGATALYTGALAGNISTLIVDALPVDGGIAHSITARYDGATDFSASTSSPTAVTVAPASLDVTADAKTKTYGDALPPLTASYAGFVLGESASVINGTPGLTTTGSSSSSVGSYPITVALGSLTAANYTFHLVDGTLKITAAPLTVTADNKSRPYGALNPSLTASYAGFVNGDTAATAIGGAPYLETTALANSPVGDYAINVTQGTLANIDPLAPNYTFDFVNGTLTVAKDDTNTFLSTSTPNPSVHGQSVTFTATVHSTQGITPTGTVTFKNGAATLGTGALSVDGVATFATGALAASGSPHSITATYAGSNNFNASPASTIVSQIVNKAATTTRLTAAPPNPSPTGQAVTVNFTVTVSLPGGGTPTGTVTVTDGTVSCSASVADGHCSLMFTTAGAKSLTARYNGDGNFAVSTSAAAIHTVTLSECTPPALAVRPPSAQQAGGPNRLFLPFVQNSQGAPMPNLIVQSIAPVSNKLQVVLLNQGSAPVRDEFWVDLYINPRPVPTKVNQVWPNLASRGGVWGVTAGGITALTANGTLTLTTGDSYFWPSLSNISGTWPTGTCVYAQVDSANATTSHGSVLENHEANGGTYDNVSGLRLSGSVTLSGAAGAQSRQVPSNRLPRRP